jgi:hypothetical protein
MLCSGVYRAAAAQWIQRVLQRPDLPGAHRCRVPPPPPRRVLPLQPPPIASLAPPPGSGMPAG